jgi:hypothetical protein
MVGRKKKGTATAANQRKAAKAVADAKTQAAIAAASAAGEGEEAEEEDENEEDENAGGKGTGRAEAKEAEAVEAKVNVELIQTMLANAAKPVSQQPAISNDQIRALTEYTRQQSDLLKRLGKQPSSSSSSPPPPVAPPDPRDKLLAAYAARLAFVEKKMTKQEAQVTKLNRKRKRRADEDTDSESSDDASEEEGGASDESDADGKDEVEARYLRRLGKAPDPFPAPAEVEAFFRAPREVREDLGGKRFGGPRSKVPPCMNRLVLTARDPISSGPQGEAGAPNGAAGKAQPAGSGPCAHRPTNQTSHQRTIAGPAQGQSVFVLILPSAAPLLPSVSPQASATRLHPTFRRNKTL